MTCAERKPRRNESAAREIADRQFGVISREPGARRRSRHTRRSRDASQAGLWDRVLPRVYRVAGAPRSREQSAMAAVLWAGDDALVSHAAAAVLWEFDGVRARKVELWVPTTRNVAVGAGHGASRQAARSGRSHDARRRSRSRRRSARLIDMAGRLEDHRLLDRARRPHPARSRHARALARSARRAAELRAAGRGRLAALAGRRAATAAARVGARDARLAAHPSSGVPLPARQHWVVARRRALSPRLRVARPQGRRSSATARSTTATGRRWGKDRARLAEFAAAGWRVLPVTWDVVHATTRSASIRWLRRGARDAA